MMNKEMRNSMLTIAPLFALMTIAMLYIFPGVIFGIVNGQIGTAGPYIPITYVPCGGIPGISLAGNAAMFIEIMTMFMSASYIAFKRREAKQ